MSRYGDVENGEWLRPRSEGFKFQCCDCGLVHRLDFRVVDGWNPTEVRPRFRAEFRAFRDNRATAAVRRERRKRDAGNP